MAITITATENIDDRAPALDLVGGMFGKLFGDRIYISAKLTRKLTEQGVHLATRRKEKYEEYVDAPIRQNAVI